MEKSNIIAGIEARRFLLLCRITRQGEEKSSSKMQSPAAHTLPVKLLTSTNDFIMTGPTIPQTQTFILSHAVSPTQHNFNEFYQGMYFLFNGSVKMLLLLTELYSSCIQLVYN